MVCMGNSLVGRYVAENWLSSWLVTRIDFFLSATSPAIEISIEKYDLRSVMISFCI